MQKPEKKTCYRCGKERVVSKTWKEKVGNSIVETTEYVCTDEKCEATQKKDLRNQKNKRLQMEKRKRDSLRDRKKLAAHNKALRS